MKNLILLAVLSLAIASAAQAQFKEGDWELRLSGSGNSTKEFDDTVLSANGSLGYFLTTNFEVSVVQSAAYADDSFAGATALAIDFNVPLTQQWEAFVGIAGGITYGHDTDDSFFVSPRTGIRYFLNNDAFIFASIEYRADVDDFEDGSWGYGIGVGMRL